MKAFLPNLLLGLGVLLGPLFTSLALAQGSPAPTTGDTLLRVAVVSCKWAKLEWTNGDGENRALVLADLSDADPDSVGVPVAPAQGQHLVGSPFFGTGGFTRNKGFAVYTGPGNAATVRNLIKGHVYMALLYPYNEDLNTGGVTYLLAAPDTLVFTTPPCPNVSPSVAASNLVSTPVDCSTLTLSCTPGNGQRRLFVIRKTNSIFQGDVSIDQENYLFPSELFARGFQTKPNSGAYVVYAGTGSSVTVYGLAPDQLYKWAVYEFNTVPGPDGFPDGLTPFYEQNNIPTALAGVPDCTGDEPRVSSVDNKQHQTRDAAVLPGTLGTRSVGIKWHPSITPAHELFGTNVIVPAGPDADNDGEGHYVVIHNVFTPNAQPLPVQNTTPLVLSTTYGLGSKVRPGMDSIYSVKLTYDWRDTTVTITGLRPGTTYTVNVFTFRFPRQMPGTVRQQTPFTYFLSSPQAAVTFTTMAAPLPVSLVAFSAQHRAGSPSVEITWRTASEVNNAGFGIERSLDGRAWTRLEFVASRSANSSRTQDYARSSPYVGAAYYRLRQQDLDGSAAYSPISYVRDASAAPATLAVYPNPTSGTFSVVGADSSQALDVYDLLGQRVLSVPAGVSAGTLSGLPGGVYVLRQGAAYTRLVRQ